MLNLKNPFLPDGKNGFFIFMIYIVTQL